ncbi:MAG TPA: YbjQ family protein [Gammaproteobacteria bacterium]|nr:YbjQ family protein [Gammaproteobacteria bacterium]
MSNLIIFLLLLVSGYGFGRYIEQRHYKSILQREKEYSDVVLTTVRRPASDVELDGSELVTGSVVISVDYFKRFLAGLRNLLGGRMTSYETLLDRGRREAILRMKQQARAGGANMVFNVKMETASISKDGGSALGSVEILAYGTATTVSMRE